MLYDVRHSFAYDFLSVLKINPLTQKIIPQI